MRFATAVPVIGLVLAVAGGASAAAPTNASWARAANAICAATNAKIRALPTVSSEEIMISDARRIGRLGAESDAALAAIPRPAADRSLIVALVAKSRTGGSLFRGAYLRALVRRDSAAAIRLAARLAKIGNEYNAIARRLGAHACAENPVPSAKGIVA